MNNDLEVLPITPLNENEKLPYHPHLPSVAKNRGFILTLIGSTQSGKTTLINNLLLNKHFWGGKKNAFDAVYIFSPSIYMDDSCRFLKEHFTCFTKYEDSTLKGILEQQEQFAVKDMPKICIVIDDSVGMIGRDAELNHFLSRYRHWNCNVILSVQSFKAISPIGRANATDVCLMNGICNAKEWEKISDEYNSLYKGNLDKLYEEATAQPFHFLYMKMRANPPEAYHNFQTKIYPGKGYRNKKKNARGNKYSNKDEDYEE
tara:strand:- start:5586 stop:6365 length:780 start_codon:yes stop_codon:yes gene_type:complete